MKIDTGSFRDPSGFVFVHKEQVYRSLDKSSADVISRLTESGLLAELIKDEMIVPTSIVDTDSSLHKELLGLVSSASSFLHHEKIPFVSYPYEWSASMLADAAELTLRLQKKLLQKGYSLKDATAYNIQFKNGKPIFIDIPSIEIPERLDVWVAYGQFCRMFLFPLLLRKYRAYDTKGYFLSHIEGMDVIRCREILGFLNSIRPMSFVDVFLQALLQRQTVSKRSAVSASSSPVRQNSQDSAVQQINLERLSKKINRLRGKTASTAVDTTKSESDIASAWVEYDKINTYSDETDKQKVEFIRKFLAEQKPSNVFDLGCNTGKYSMLALDVGASVVAVDGDHDCVDLLYNRSQEKKLLPLWIDASNPSPGIGFMNKERRSFLERSNFDCVFALALMHHLLITSRMPLASIRDMLWKLTDRWLVIECVPEQDAMFQTLMSLRENIYEQITTKHFEEVFSERFSINTSLPLQNAHRSLYVMEKE